MSFQLDPWGPPFLVGIFACAAWVLLLFWPPPPPFFFFFFFFLKHTGSHIPPSWMARAGFVSVAGIHPSGIFGEKACMRAQTKLRFILSSKRVVGSGMRSAREGRTREPLPAELSRPTMAGFVLLVGCLTSQQHASVSRGRISSDNFTCCHTEIEVADQNVLPHPVTVY